MWLLTDANVIPEQDLLARLARDDQSAFRDLFDAYYPYLVASAFPYLNDTAKARDFAQDVFVDVWDKRNTLAIDRNLKAYLRRAVVNRCLNYLKRERRLDFSTHEDLPPVADSQATPEQTLAAEDLSRALQVAVGHLPERCRIIFQLSRHEHLSRGEIASQLGITVKTVENQLTKALKAIRQVVSRHAATIILGLLVWGGTLLSIVYLLPALLFA